MIYILPTTHTHHTHSNEGSCTSRSVWTSILLTHGNGKRALPIHPESLVVVGGPDLRRGLPSVAWRCQANFVSHISLSSVPEFLPIYSQSAAQLLLHFEFPSQMSYKGCKVVNCGKATSMTFYLKHYSRTDADQSFHSNSYLCFLGFPSSVKSWTSVDKVLLLWAVLAGRQPRDSIQKDGLSSSRILETVV